MLVDCFTKFCAFSRVEEASFHWANVTIETLRLMLEEQQKVKIKKGASTGTNTTPEVEAVSETELRQQVEELTAETDRLLRRDEDLNSDFHSKLKLEQAKAEEALKAQESYLKTTSNEMMQKWMSMLRREWKLLLGNARNEFFRNIKR